MDTLKSIFKPGGNKDDEVLYGDQASTADPNKGKVAGEGSHFGKHSHTDSGIGGLESPTAATSTVTSSAGQQTGGREFPLSSTAGTTGVGSTVDTTASDNLDRSAAGTTPTGLAASSSVVPGPATTTHDISSASADAIVGQQPVSSDKCVDTLHDGPHVTQIAQRIDPCYEGGAATGIGVATTTDVAAGATTTTSSAAQPTIVPSNFAPGTTAPSTTQTPVAAPVSISQPTTTDRSADPHAPANHGGRNTTSWAGTGAGAATGATAGALYEASQDDRAAANPPIGSSTVAPTSTAADKTSHGPYTSQPVDPRIDNNASATAGETTTQYRTLDPKADEEANKTHEHHYGRDAAAGAGAGAAAVTAEHEFSKHDAEKQAKEEAKEQKQVEKEQAQQQKQVEKEQAKEHKEAEKEQAKAEKQAEKEQKQAEKEQVKAEKQAEKEQAKAEKEAEKEAKKQEKEEKPSLISRILHRNKDDKEEKSSHKHEAEAAGAGAAGGAALAEEQSHSRNKLHKDPPPGYADAPAKGYASQVTGGTGTTALARGDPSVPTEAPPQVVPVGGAADVVPGTRYGSGADEHLYHSGDAAEGVRRTSVVAAGGTVQSQTPFAPAPQTGYASQVTGGTGTTQLAEGNRDPVTNPRKTDPLHDGPKGYAATVTGGTGTTVLAQGNTAVPEEPMVPGRHGSVAGVETTTEYIDGPKAGTGKYAEQVTGGTGTTQLAQGQHDEVANPTKTLTEKVEDALVMR